MRAKAALVRILRAKLLDELNQPYVTTARAKGRSELRLLLRYPVRIAINPTIPTLGWILPARVSGEIIVSVVMSQPTTGPQLLRSLPALDMELDQQAMRRMCTRNWEEPVPIGFFAAAEPYRLRGWIELETKLFGARDPGQMVYLMGADRLGREIFGRVVHGARISLSIGLLGVVSRSFSESCWAGYPAGMAAGWIRRSSG